MGAAFNLSLEKARTLALEFAENVDPNDAKALPASLKVVCPVSFAAALDKLHTRGIEKVSKDLRTFLEGLEYLEPWPTVEQVEAYGYLGADARRKDGENVSTGAEEDETPATGTHGAH